MESIGGLLHAATPPSIRQSLVVGNPHPRGESPGDVHPGRLVPHGYTDEHP